MEPRPNPCLARIRVYPLKGAGGCDLEETCLDAFGIPGDRRWMLVKPNGDFISQRTHPRLCLVRATPSASKFRDPGPSGEGHGADQASAAGSQPTEGEELRFTLSAPGMGSLTLYPAPPGSWIGVRVHEDRFPALAGCAEANRWFSEFLGEACLLVFIPEEVHRPVDPKWAAGHRVSLSDGYPLHLTTEESLREVNERLDCPTTMINYRPNLVLAGGLAWEEDEWRALEIGGIRVHLVKPCARCAVTTVDPGTGTRGREPLRSLGSFREWEGKVYFGQNAVFQGTGSFRVGDEVRILERGLRRPSLPV